MILKSNTEVAESLELRGPPVQAMASNLNRPEEREAKKTAALVIIREESHAVTNPASSSWEDETDPIKNGCGD